MVIYLFYTIGDLTYQSPLVTYPNIRFVNFRRKNNECDGRCCVQWKRVAY